MAKLRLLYVLCLLMCFVTHGGSEETERDLGVLAGNFIPELKNDNDRQNDPEKSDVMESVPLSHDPQLSILDSRYQSQPAVPLPATRDGDSGDSTVRSETDRSKEADGTAVGENQLSGQENPKNLNTHSSEKDMGVLGALESLALNNKEETGMEKDIENTGRNRLDEENYNTQSSHVENSLVNKLSWTANGNIESDLKAESQKSTEGPVQRGQGDEDSQVLNTQSSHTNEADNGMLGNLRGPLSESTAETEQASKNRLDFGARGASYVRPSEDQDGNVLEDTGSLIASAFARRPAMLPENANGNNGGGYSEDDQRDKNFEHDNKYEDRENVQVPDVRNVSYNFKDATDVRGLDQSVGVSTADDLGSFLNSQQPQLYNKPDWQNGEVHDDDGDDAENKIPWAVSSFAQNTDRQTEGSLWDSQQPQLDNRPDWQNGDKVNDRDGDDTGNKIPWAVNPFYGNTDRQTEEKGAENGMAEHITSRPSVETDEEEDVDFDDFYDSEDDEDDWWYFDPDRRKDDQEETAHTTWPSSVSTTSTSRLPFGTAQGREGVAEEKEGKEPPHIPEGVIEIKDVKKNMNGPKESILLYTALILIFIFGIVVFTLWKNASKTSRSKSPVFTMPVGEEGKRLLDYPFV